MYAWLTVILSEDISANRQLVNKIFFSKRCHPDIQSVVNKLKGLITSKGPMHTSIFIKVNVAC